MEHAHRFSKLIGVVVAVAALVLLLLWMQGIVGGGKIRPGTVPGQSAGLTEPHGEGTVGRTRFLKREEAVGTVKTKREVLIAPRIMGTILELPVRAGDRVDQGQVLARLDDRDARTRLEQARSGVVEAESESSRAQTDYRRFERLRQQNAVPQQQFEQAQAAYRAAAARLKMAREALKEAEINVGFSEIRSPVTGFVVEKDMEVGDMASPGRPILLVQEGGTLRLEAAVREGLAGTVELGAALKVKVDAIQQELTGTVEEKVPEADPRSRSFLVRVALPLTPGLRSGMFGRLYIPTGTVTPLTVPAGAIQRNGQLEQVWVISDSGEPSKRYVRTGETFEEHVEVLSGLDEGERVVVFTPSAATSTERAR
jgi:RND family efflux transporter MFP subunit